MPCTAVYFRNRSTLACLSCLARVPTAAGPRSPVIASTIDWRVSGDRDGAMAKVALRVAVVSADEVAAVDHQDVAVDIIRGPAGQEDHRPHQVGGLPQRAAGMCSTMRRSASGSARVASVMAVLKYPGAMALTWMLQAASSSQ